MAWAKGTADDFVDFLRKFRDFATGALDPLSDPDFTDGSGVVPSGEVWSDLGVGAGESAIPGSGMATDGLLYLQGQGSDPDDEIVVAVKTYRNVGNNVFGWDLRGFTAFNAALTFDTMPGVSPSCFAAFDDAAFDIWLYANARRLMAVARIGTTDILIHAGFIQQFGTRSQYPYPLLIGGSVSGITINFQANHFGQSCFPDPCDNGGQLRWIDGTWQEIANYANSSAQRSSARIATGYTVWPHRNPTTNADGNETIGAAGNEDALFEQYATGSSVLISSAEINAYPRFPSVLMNSSALIGRIDGLHTVFGLGLIKGDTLTDASESPPAIYDVFGNTWRTEPVDFFAIRRE